MISQIVNAMIIEIMTLVGSLILGVMQAPRNPRPTIDLGDQSAGEEPLSTR
jgi:hypothetical protein